MEKYQLWVKALDAACQRLRAFACAAVFAVFAFPLECAAQDDLEMDLARKYAEHSYREGDYAFALENYLKLYELDKSDINVNFRIGVCYTETNLDRTGGIPYLEFVTSHNNFPHEALFYLGKAYLFNYQFPECVEAMYEYKIVGSDDNLIALSERYVVMAYNALELINFPKPVRFELLDTAVNSRQNDFRPLVTADQSKLFFTSDRRYIDETASYQTDIYISEGNRTGLWDKSRILEISTLDHDEIVGISPTGNRIMVYTNGDLSTHEIKMAERKGKGYAYVEKSELPAGLNMPSFENSACINSEGDIIIFASDRLGGYGGMDLYKVIKVDKRTWGEPENLGSVINTPFDESYPTLSVDGGKLHFSSNAHSSIGGMDLFYSVFNFADSSFQRPINHGFPISTPFDDISISFNADESVAYLATNRTEGIGNLDIYKVYVGNSSTPEVLIIGMIMVGEGDAAVPYSPDMLKAHVSVYDVQGNLFARYAISDEGMFFATVYPGDYILDVRFDKAADGFREQLKIVEGQDVERTIFLKEP